MFCLHMCLCTAHTSGALRTGRWPGPQDVELQMVGRCHVGAVIQTRSSAKQIFFTAEPSLQEHSPYSFCENMPIYCERLLK